MYYSWFIVVLVQILIQRFLPTFWRLKWFNLWWLPSMFSFLTSLRFGGRECGFPVPQEAIHQFDGILPAQHSLCGDDNLQIHFADLERQSGLVPPVNWTTAVQNYISLKSFRNIYSCMVLQHTCLCYLCHWVAWSAKCREYSCCMNCIKHFFVLHLLQLFAINIVMGKLIMLLGKGNTDLRTHSCMTFKEI